jgi:hypothetical protein
MKALAPITALFLLFASTAHAQDQEPEQKPVPEAEPPPPPAPRTVLAEALEPSEPRFDVIRLNAGLKMGYITTDGFDAFSKNNALPQFSIDGTLPVLTRDKLVLGVGLGWDMGARSAAVRGLHSELTTHRMTVPIEVRWNYVPGLYTFVKVAPGAAAMVASVSDGSRKLGSTGWAFAADASVGASILLGSRKKLDQRGVHFWITPEGGYGLTTAARLRANPGRPDDQVLGSDEDTSLRSLALSGAFWRITASATY